VAEQGWPSSLPVLALLLRSNIFELKFCICGLVGMASSPNDICSVVEINNFSMLNFVAPLRIY
jgi:hypothetical protein